MIPDPDYIPHKIAFGGGCHWCTEAYFQSLKGVLKTEQGWISAAPPQDSFAEAVIVYYDPLLISLRILTEIHLYTHACTRNHSMRNKYRSAVYVFNGETAIIEQILLEEQVHFPERIITEILCFKAFRRNTNEYQDYYQKHKAGVFCERYIHPKLLMLQSRYAEYFQQI